MNHRKMMNENGRGEENGQGRMHRRMMDNDNYEDHK